VGSDVWFLVVEVLGVLVVEVSLEGVVASPAAYEEVDSPSASARAVAYRPAFFNFMVRSIWASLVNGDTRRLRSCAVAYSGLRIILL